MSISIERKSAHYLQKLAELNYLFLVFAATVMPFHASMAADTPSPPRAAGVMVWHQVITVEEPPKTEVSPQQAKCLLALGDAPLGKKLLPGISKGIVNPDEASAADASAKTRTWSAPSLYEPEFMLHYVEISSSRFQVRGVYLDAPPYHVEMLILRDSTVTLPCGLRVGQMLDQFTKVLGQPTGSWLLGGKVEYSGYEYYTPDFAESALPNITLQLGPDGDAQEIQWEYAVD